MPDSTKDKESPGEKFERLLKKVISVPKTEIDRREAKERKAKKESS